MDEIDEMLPHYDFTGGVRGKYVERYKQGIKITIKPRSEKLQPAKDNPRDTYKYQFKVGNRIVHGGITKDLKRRGKEHLQRWPTGHIEQVGRRTTEVAARAWEKEERARLAST